MEIRDFKVGKEYVLQMYDCCIKGTIKAGKFLGYKYDEDGEIYEYIFQNCDIGPGWGKWRDAALDENLP